MGLVHPHAGGAAVPDRQPVLRLEVRVRAGAAHERPPHLPRPRQGARRLQQHQRDDLPARQPAGLRALGGATRAWRPGTTPTACRTSSGWRRCLARRRRVPRRATARSCSSAARRTNPLFGAFFEAVAAGRLPADRRRQRLPAGGLRRVRPQHPPRPAAERGAGLPAPGAWTGRTSTVRPARLVTRILFEGTRAVGVEIARRTGAAADRSTAGEVILCGGAINSPQLLQLSGVGNAGDLRGARHRRGRTTCPASARTCRTTSRSTSSTPARSRSRWHPALQAGATGR